MHLSPDWITAIFTIIYVIATIFICVYNAKSAKAAREQTQEMKRQYEEDNRPYVTVEFIFERKSFFGLRFVNHGRKTAEHVRITFNEQFIDSLDTDYQNMVKNQNGKECIIGVEQHYDIFIADRTMRQNNAIAPVIGKIDYTSAGNKYETPFEIDIENYMTIFSVGNDENGIEKELGQMSTSIKQINDKLGQIAAKR